MLEALAILLVLGVIAGALLLTRDVCRRYPVAGALGLAAGAALVAVAVGAVVPRNDDAVPWGPGFGTAIALILVVLAHYGVAAVLVVVAFIQGVVAVLRAHRSATEQERTVIGDPLLAMGDGTSDATVRATGDASAVGGRGAAVARRRPSTPRHERSTVPGVASAHQRWAVVRSERAGCPAPTAAGGPAVDAPRRTAPQR